MNHDNEYKKIQKNSVLDDSRGMHLTQINDCTVESILIVDRLEVFKIHTAYSQERAMHYFNII